MLNPVLRDLCQQVLGDLSPEDVHRRYPGLLEAFVDWRETAVETEPRGLRDGRTVQGHRFATNADLVCLLLAAHDQGNCEAPLPFAPDEVVAALLHSLDETISPPYQREVTKTLAAAITRRAQKAAATRAATSPRTIPGLVDFLRARRRARTRVLTKTVWAELEELRDPITIPPHTKLIVRNGALVARWRGGKRSINWEAFKRYWTMASSKKSQ